MRATRKIIITGEVEIDTEDCKSADFYAKDVIDTMKCIGLSNVNVEVTDTVTARLSLQEDN